MSDTDEKLIRACQEYFKYNARFQHKGSDEAGLKARYWLSEIRNEASKRRMEIQAVREERKKARNGQNGRPKKVSS